jgi:peptide/nickel transport system substrate-binding protein
MGTGPWKITSFDPTSGEEYVANPHWWGGKVPFARISFKFFSDETSEALAWRAGDLDVAPNLQGPAAFAATSGAHIVTVPSCRQGYFSFNVTAAPWNDLHVRRAVAYALNRTDLVKADGGYGTPSYTFIPVSQLRTIASQAQIDALLKSVDLYRFDLEKAKAELAKSAYPNGFSGTLQTTNFGNYVDFNQVAAAELQKIGINLTVKVVPIGAFLGALVGAPASRPAALWTNGCISPDPSYYMRSLGRKNAGPGALNIAEYTPASMEDLLRASIGSTNPAKRFAVYAKILKQLSVDVPYLSLWVENSNAALSPKYSWPTFDGDFLFTTAWALGIKPK